MNKQMILTKHLHGIFHSHLSALEIQYLIDYKETPSESHGMKGK